MDSERWKRVERIYHQVLACPPQSRAAVLEKSCGDDSGLRQELESLLNARDEAGLFLSPAEFEEYLGELAAPPEPPLIGHTLDHYEVIGKIGSGAMGVVYQARDIRLDRNVVLKLLPAQFTHNIERVARFRREAKAASALNHPNIVTIYDIAQAGDRWFIVAELIEGVSLRHCLSTRKLSHNEVVDIAVQCAMGLQAAHRSGVVHRDIKPENIMIRPDGGVKIVDFGLAGIIENGPGPAAQISASGAIMGTPRYMSPEQARGQKLDARTDIFSLGAVIYEMATNRPAFPGANAAEVFATLLGETAPPALGPPFDRILRKALAKDRNERYQSAEELAVDLNSIALKRANRKELVSRPLFPAAKGRKRYAWAALIALLVMTIGAILWSRHARRQNLLTEKDTLLITDFRNQTGDPLFDPTLKEGLAVQLEQSPFLTILSDSQVRETLLLMKRHPGETITPEIGREICQRRGLRAMITGSIAPLGRYYVLALEVIDSHSSETLARVQMEAHSKEEVLKALSQGAAQLRRKLGESLGSIQKYDALLERTTSSLEALQAYSLGYRERRRGHSNEAIRLFLKAVELDPGFAYAYSDLATTYRNTKHPSTAAQFAVKAYLFRDRVSEREKLRITSIYYEYVTGELDKQIETLKLYQQIYPRDPLPYNNLGVGYAALGQYEKAVEQSRMSMLLDPDAASRFSTLANFLIHLNRFDEAEAFCEKAIRAKRDSLSVHHSLHRIALIHENLSAMQQQERWAVNHAAQHAAFDWQAGAAAFGGQWRSSSEYARRALETAEQNNDPEIMALYGSDFALNAAVLGKCGEARSAARQSLSQEHTQLSLAFAGLASELCGDTAVPHVLELTRRYSKNKIVLSIWLPVLRAAAHLKRGNAVLTIEALKPTEDFEAAAQFWPQFLRGQAYLRQGKGIDSAKEFNKILDHRGQGSESVLYPLAQLGAARAAVTSGDTVTARQLYLTFLANWKNADSDLAPLLAAQKEFKNLK